MSVGWYLARWWRWLGLTVVMLPRASLQARQVLYAAMDNWPPFIIERRSLASDSGFDGIDWELWFLPTLPPVKLWRWLTLRIGTSVSRTCSP